MFAHIFQLGTCGFKDCMKYSCAVQMALPGYSWISVVVQGLNQNYMKAESQPVKQTPQNNPILFKGAGPLA